MLLEFIFRNSYSYQNETYFSMEAVKKTQIKNEFSKFNKHRILKSAVTFGPNASGKSNLLKSLKTFQDLVMRDDKESNPYPSYTKNNQPIYYEVTIYADKKIYRYAVEYLQDEILSEKLELEKDGEFCPYFTRNKSAYEVLPEELAVLSNKTRKDSLFLNTAKAFNDEHSLNVFRWFRNNLFFITRDITPLVEQAYKFQRNVAFKSRLLSFLQAADLNIVDFEIVKSDAPIPLEFSRLMPELKYKMTIQHKFDGNSDETFTLGLDEESDGTRKFIALAIILISLRNSTICIDEFDDSFHVELSKALIEVFNSEENTNQFILTSHELSLMDCNFKKEQIYFAEKTKGSATDLYSVYDFKSEENRNDYSYVKRYRKGMFGAIPEILVGRLKQAIEGE